MSDFEAAVEKAMGLADFERSKHSPKHSSFHLERMNLLSDKLGSVHRGGETVHIAGTKGKGSTAAMISAILTSSGYRVGLFTSPHIHNIVERVRVDLEPISKQDFASLVEQIWPIVESMSVEEDYGGVTFFELMTALAFLHFRQVSVDYQVIEVGLGGRLDSTNIVDATLSVITSISLDHVETLGDTIEKIAREKSGIIKSDAPVVVAPQADPDVNRVINEVADSRRAPVIEVRDLSRWTKRKSDTTGQAFTLSGIWPKQELWMPLIGDHQLENAATAVTAVQALGDERVSPESVTEGLRNVRWPGRLETLQYRGYSVVVDGAHNPYSINCLVKAVQEYFTFERVVLVFASLGGHNARGMLDELTALNPRVVVVRSRHPRSGPVARLVDIVNDLGLDIAGRSETVGGGLCRAVDVAREGDLLLCTGSLSVVAEVIEEIRGIQPELYQNLEASPEV